MVGTQLHSCTIRILEADPGDKVRLKKAPIPTHLGTRQPPLFGLGTDGVRMHVEECCGSSKSEENRRTILRPLAGAGLSLGVLRFRGVVQEISCQAAASLKELTIHRENRDHQGSADARTSLLRNQARIPGDRRLG